MTWNRFPGKRRFNCFDLVV